MLPQSKYIIFHVPPTKTELIRPRFPTPRRNCRYISGNYNKKLVCDILSYNGIQPAVSERDKKVTIYWGTCLEVSNQQISQYGNSSSGYNNHNFNPILSGPVNNYSGNLDNANILFKYNHFPNSKLFLGNKAEFAYIIQKNPAYDLFPRILPYTYILPRDRDSLFKAMRNHPSTSYIAKPPSGSCGNGIKIVTYADFYFISPNAVVSEYITRPLCIDGFKFDLRVYVLVTSFSPLRAFVAKEGLARFATESYSPTSSNVYSHLTNATLNKKSRHWENGAFKWKLSELIQEVAYRMSNQNLEGNSDSRESQKSAQERLMNTMLNTIALTLALVQPSMCPKERRRLVDPCFELFGFDLIFDRNLKPYILEVNTMPSLNTDEDVDYEVKAPLLAQAFSIAGIPDISGDRLNEAVRSIKIPRGGIREFDAEIVKQEDLRNKLSGDGFIRIFPSEKYSSKYEQILTEPPLHPKLLRMIEQMMEEPNEVNSHPSHFIAKSKSTESIDEQKKERENANELQQDDTKQVANNDIKSKTLPFLAIPSPPNKPSTNNGARIKMAASNTLNQQPKIRQIGTPALKAGNELNHSRLNFTTRSNKLNGENDTNRQYSSSEQLAKANSSKFSPEVGAAVLALYLNKIEVRLRATSDSGLASRAQCFLVAQGYKVARGVTGVRSNLQHYVGQIKSWSSVSISGNNSSKQVVKTGYKNAIPEKLKQELMTGDDEAFKRILVSSDLPMVKNIRLLFK